MKSNYTLTYSEGGERKEKHFVQHHEMVDFIKQPGILYLASTWPDHLKQSSKGARL